MRPATAVRRRAAGTPVVPYVLAVVACLVSTLAVALPASAAPVAGTPATAASAREAAASPRPRHPLHTRPQLHGHQVLFRGGERSATGVAYHSFRIPSLVRTTKGTLLAFAEGRVVSALDHGDIDLVYKRSVDGGRTWSKLRAIASAGTDTWGNPTAVVDERRRTVWLFMSWNSRTKSRTGGGGTERIDSWGDRRVFLSVSRDDGKGWSAPRDMTKTLLPRGYTWDAVGPGVGIQTEAGPRPGRLVVPASGRNIYSDDGGRTWKVQRIPGGTGEGTVVELDDGTLMRNDRASRRTWPKAQRRWVSRGTIGGGFSRFEPDGTLIDSRVQGSILRYPGDRSRILFLNPATTTDRCRMRLRVSYDDARTWPIGRAIHDDPKAPARSCQQDKGGYSSLAPTTPLKVGMLIEANQSPGDPHGRRSIEFHQVNLPWILGGRPEPAVKPRVAGWPDAHDRGRVRVWGRIRHGWTGLLHARGGGKG